MSFFQRLLHFSKLPTHIAYWRTLGFREGLRRMRMTDDINLGIFKGRDHMGNEYWENPHAIIGRTRYVIYSDLSSYDPSQVPAEWYGWLHYRLDPTPVEQTPVEPIYKLPHQSQRLSQIGAKAQYVPTGSFWRKEGQRDWTHSRYKTWKDEYAETAHPTRENTTKNPPKVGP